MVSFLCLLIGVNFFFYHVQLLGVHEFNILKLLFVFLPLIFPFFDYFFNFSLKMMGDLFIIEMLVLLKICLQCFDAIE